MEGITYYKSSKCSSQTINAWTVPNFMLNLWLYYLQSLMCSDVFYTMPDVTYPEEGKTRRGIS